MPNKQPKFAPKGHKRIPNPKCLGGEWCANATLPAQEDFESTRSRLQETLPLAATQPSLINVHGQQIAQSCTA